MQHNQFISRVILSFGLVLLAPLQLACGTTHAAHGRMGGEDTVASGFENRMELLNEAIADQDLHRAEKAQVDLDKYLEKNRREIELHPEGSMMLSRYDLVMRRMRQFKIDWAEQEAARIKLEAENKVREPVDQASAMVAALEGPKAPRMDQVKALKEAIDKAQNALNDARRNQQLAIDGSLTLELQQQLDALDKSFLNVRAKAQAVLVRDLLLQGRQAQALTEGPGDVDEKQQAFSDASKAFQDCQRQGEQILQRHSDLANYRLATQGQRKRKKLKSIVSICARRLDKIQARQKKLQVQQQGAEEQAEQLQSLLQDKSPAQQRVLKKWGRAPDVIKQRRGKELWIYVQKKGRRRHRHEYTFNQAGKLIKERRR